MRRDRRDLSRYTSESLLVNDVERLLELDEEIFATLVVFVRFEKLIPRTTNMDLLTFCLQKLLHDQKWL